MATHSDIALSCMRSKLQCKRFIKFHNTKLCTVPRGTYLSNNYIPYEPIVPYCHPWSYLLLAKVLFLLNEYHNKKQLKVTDKYFQVVVSNSYSKVTVKHISI